MARHERSRSRGGRCRVREPGSVGAPHQIISGHKELPVTHLRKIMLEELSGVYSSSELSLISLV